MQNLIQKFRQNSIVFEKPGILSKKLKTLTSSNYHRVMFFAEISHTFPSYFLELSAKIKNTLFFTFSLITQDLKKIKKISNTLLYRLVSSKRVQNFSKNIKLYGSWSSS